MSKFVFNPQWVKTFDNKVRQWLFKAWSYLQGKRVDWLKADLAYDTGDLIWSIATEFVDSKKVRVWTNKPQWYVIEYWRKPWRFPPLDSLVWWAGRHWFIRGNKTARYNELNSKDKWSVYVLARSISRKGIKPRQTFSRVYKQNADWIINVFSKHMKWTGS